MKNFDFGTVSGGTVLSGSFGSVGSGSVILPAANWRMRGAKYCQNSCSTCLTVSMRKPSKSAAWIQRANTAVSAARTSSRFSVARSFRPPGKSPVSTCSRTSSR